MSGIQFLLGSGQPIQGGDGEEHASTKTSSLMGKTTDEEGPNGQVCFFAGLETMQDGLLPCKGRSGMTYLLR